MTNDAYLACVESGSQSTRTEAFVSESGGTGVANRHATGESNLVGANDRRKDQNLLDALTIDLSALLRLHLHYKVYEWTIDGRSWFVHRSLFVELGGAVSSSIDLVAERIVALGGSPAANTGGQVPEVQQRISAAVHDSPQGMLATVYQAEHKIVEQLDHHIGLARANEDHLTSEVLSHLRTKHERHVGELASHMRMDSAPNHSKRAHAGAYSSRSPTVRAGISFDNNHLPVRHTSESNLSGYNRR